MWVRYLAFMVHIPITEHYLARRLRFGASREWRIAQVDKKSKHNQSSPLLVSRMIYRCHPTVWFILATFCSVLRCSDT